MCYEISADALKLLGENILKNTDALSYDISAEERLATKVVRNIYYGFGLGTGLMVGFILENYRQTGQIDLALVGLLGFAVVHFPLGHYLLRPERLALLNDSKWETRSAEILNSLETGVDTFSSRSFGLKSERRQEEISHSLGVVENLAGEGPFTRFLNPLQLSGNFEIEVDQYFDADRGVLTVWSALHV